MKFNLVLFGAIVLGLLQACKTQKHEIQHLTLAPEADSVELVFNSLNRELDKLRPLVIMPAEGYLQYPYLIPGGFYKQMWDWDGFFIGNHLASLNPTDGKYLKYWSLNFLNAVDSTGYVAGCITTEGPRPIFGRFAMKPFLAQGCYFSASYLEDFEWIRPYFESLKMVMNYRENYQKDEETGLFFWEIAMQSGADNNPVLNYFQDDERQFLACDMNTWQYREYLAMIQIAEALGLEQDALLYTARSNTLKNQIVSYLWDDEDQSFYNMERGTQELVKRVSYSNFIPLIEDFIEPEKASEMILRYLWNEDHLLAPYGLRSLSKQDEAYNNKNIIVPFSNWQGPVWPIANYLYSMALVNNGFEAEAQQLAGHMAKLLLNDIYQYGSMHENYHADTGEPLAPTAEQSEDGVFTGFIGWNLLVYNMMRGATQEDWLLLEIKTDREAQR